jgi:5'-nucleotidase
MPSLKQVLVGALGIGLPLTGLSLLASPAQANKAGTGVVISEVYGGGGNSGSTWRYDFVELYNPTDAPISVEGWTLQARSATNTSTATADNTVKLTGSVPAHGHYLIRHAAGSGGTKDLPVADAVGNAAMGASGWQVWLSNGSTLLDPPDGNVSLPAIVDFVGAATNSTSYEGAPADEAPSATLSAQRSATGADTDSNAADFGTAGPTPTNADGETEPPLTAVDPGDKYLVEDQPASSFQLTATAGTAPYTWTATGLPEGLEMAADGTVSGTPLTQGIYDVTATVTDSSEPAETDDVTFMVVVDDDHVRPIAAIQGTGPRSPFAPATGTDLGRNVTTLGVVTAMYRDGGYNGMYIQSPATGGQDDLTPGRSDAIFVFGSSSMPADVAIGDSVQVTGRVSEFAGTTEITPASGGVVELADALEPVSPLPTAYPTTEEAREAQEGMLLAPTDTFTVTNVFNTNTFAEVGLATGDRPLVQPTEVADDDDAAALAAVKQANTARGVVLDDGASVNYMTNEAAQDLPLPYLTPDNPIRVGAAATLHAPVILEFRNNTWKFQPTQRVTDDGSAVVTFEDTRPQNTEPQDVGGDVRLATFNVLNYFNTTGEAYDARANTSCTFYTDRDGNRIGVNSCGTPNADSGNGPRGAATQASFERQQAKIVTAINTMGADIVGLQEIENSIKLLGETDRDDALAALVAALNADAGAGTWDFVHSPAESTVTATGGAVSQQDVIRPAFIYKPAKVRPVGQSDILFDTTEFANAREPLAQAFKQTGGLNADAFAVILNHFKSKGDSSVPATGDNANNPDTGAFNGDRVRQATRLAQFAEAFAAERGIEAVFLAGDFNSYTMEDPISVLRGAGYTPVESDTEGEESYSFSGLSGSLDHVLANEAALEMVTGADIWEINANEAVAFQYSRYNYNVTQFFDADDPFAASDHNPEVIGLDLPEATTEIQLLATNDFHGRLLNEGPGGPAGAAILSGAVDELRGEYPRTVFAAAGDLIGASTFESFIQQDKPTIDALNAAGLEVSAVGNHELDKGYDDLVDRVMAPRDPATNPLGGAEWEYIAANINEPEGRDEIAPTWTKEFGKVTVGFVGAVTEDLPSLVSPAGIQGLTVTDIVDATNQAAADLRADGADLVVLLVHEGSPTTACASMTDPATTWGNIVANTSSDVDAIVSGHTHLAYNCQFPVQDWVDEGRAVTRRPVVSAGQYGTNLNQLVFKVETRTGRLIEKSQDIVGLSGAGYQPDPEVAAIVQEAAAEAEVLGAQELGRIEAPFNRAKLSTGSENRGGESTLGNLVAEVQRWATETPEAGGAQIAFMNPGGLRQDMGGTPAGDARTVTYKQAAVVQPFANTLVNMDLTGAQIETVLEQQWQRDASGNVPSRPFLRLGASAGFTYTYVETPVTVNGTPTFQGEVTGMWLNGEPIDPAATYSVTVNSFLASGGDNFWELAKGTSRADTGKVDLEAMVDYLAEFASDAPLPVDYSQRAVEVEFPANAPESYRAGDQVTFDVASWTMSTVDDLKDTEIEVRLGDLVLGTAVLDNTIKTDVYDQYGTAEVTVTLPAEVEPGDTELTLVGATTGTEVAVPITVGQDQVAVVTPPSVSGTPQVGKTLTASLGDYEPDPDSITFQWLADGQVITGATGTVLKLRSAQAGKEISIRVTASADGYADAVAESEPTAPVTKGVVKVTASVTPTRIVAGETRPAVTVKVTNADGVVPTGTVTISAKGVTTVSRRLVGGAATLRLDAFRTTGLKTLVIKYSGDGGLLGETLRKVIRVRR